MPYSDPARQREYQRRWIAAYRALHPPEPKDRQSRPCSWCGATFTPQRFHEFRPQYCSAACRQKGTRAKL